jgi:hypothetical protein
MKKVKVSTLTGCLSAVLGIVALFVLFANGLTQTLTVCAKSGSYDIAGYTVIFGGIYATIGSTTMNISGCAGLIAGWATLLCGVLIVLFGTVLSVVSPKKKKGFGLDDLLFFVGGLATISGSVVLFFAKNLEAGILGASSSNYTITLGVGFILAAIFGILSGLLAIIIPCLKRK